MQSFPAAPLRPPPRRLRRDVAGAKGDESRYARFDPLGSGPLGTVFKGKHGPLGTDVCIKELKDIFGYFSFLQRGEVLKRLKRELCAQAQVSHPAIVAVRRPGGRRAPGRTSSPSCSQARSGSGSTPRRAGRSRSPRRSAACSSSPTGCKAAHGQALFHHNLKPENVLFDARGNAKLGDFGLGRVIEVEAGKGLPQVFIGTGGMAYLAPELIARKEATAAADVYGLGILLYEMLTGQLPGRRSPLPSEVNAEAPSKLDPLFDKMTQDKPAERYPTIDALLEDFYAAFSDGEYGRPGELVLQG